MKTASLLARPLFQSRVNSVNVSPKEKWLGYLLMVYAKE